MFYKIYLFLAGLISNNLPFVREMREKIREQIGDARRVLEVGCAIGGTLGVLNSQGRFLVGIDNNREKLKIARSIKRDIQFSMMDGANLGLRDNTFDDVILSFILHEVDDYATVIREACRVSNKVIITDIGRPRGIGGIFFKMVEGEKLEKHLARNYEVEFNKYKFVKILSGNTSKNVFLNVYSKIE
ncbi:MAG: class I SAM-dependent methyltransferase [bacterium]